MVNSGPADPQVRREQAEREHRRRDQEAHGGNERIGARAARTGTVAEPAAEPRSRCTADQHDRPIEPAHVLDREAEAAVEEAREPEDQAVAEDRSGRRAERQQPEARRAHQCPRDFPHRRSRRGRGIEAAALRLRDQQLDQQRGGQAEQADDDEGAAPRQMGGEPTAEEDAERRADRNPERKESQRSGAPLAREIVRDERIGRSDPARLADRDAHPRNDQLRVILDESAGGGEQAPQRDRAGDDVDPALAVGRPGDRDGDAPRRRSRMQRRDG